MIPAMSPLTSPQGALAGLARSFVQWLAGWGRTVQLAALLSALALSPSSYRADSRRALSALQWAGVLLMGLALWAANRRAAPAGGEAGKIARRQPAASHRSAPESPS